MNVTGYCNFYTLNSSKTKWLRTQEQNELQFPRGIAIFPPFSTNQVKEAGLLLACGCLLVTTDSVHSLPPNQAHRVGTDGQWATVAFPSLQNPEKSWLHWWCKSWSHVTKSLKGLEDVSYYLARYPEMFKSLKIMLLLKREKSVQICNYK